jgi:signal transduction histidine kinase
MTRRITLTMVSVVAGALLVASLATLLLIRVSDRREARRQLGREAQRLARTVEDVPNQRLLAAVGAALKLEGEAIVSFGPNGGRLGAPPAGVDVADLDLARLRRGTTITGSHGSLSFAAAPAQRRNALVVVVLTRRIGGGRGVGPMILLVGLVTLAIAAAVAADLGRRLTRPLRQAQQATRRIAAGDLATRVPVHSGDGGELAGLAESINAMAAALERSRGMERQFLLSVSHDLRTPLTSIRGFAEALADDRAPDPDHAAGVILNEARRLERLVGDLLELAKLGAGRFSLDVRATDVGEDVGHTADGFTPAAAKAGVSLDVALPSTGPGPALAADGQAVAAADPDRLAQVVANLIENALKFARSAIAVGARMADGWVVLWVDDDGAGIAAADLAHVFEPFYQSTRAPARQVGTGLGLAIVHELVDAMGGSVRVEDRPGGGTRVVVSLRQWAAHRW